MSRLLHHLGRSTAGHPWRTISAWVLVAVAVFAVLRVLGRSGAGSSIGRGLGVVVVAMMVKR